MRIKLKRLKLENFKGIKTFELDLTGDTVEIYGANESGKTSVSDAYHWLLFNKDSKNNANFGIKTLSDGKVIHGLDHSVEGTFEIEGKEVVLKKTYREKWTKKRGSSNKEMTGHETEYEINSAPKKKGQFDAYIKEIIHDSEVFRLVSDPWYFNSLKTDKKRKLLMEISGEIKDEEVLESNSALKGLAEHLEQHTIEELHAINKKEKQSVNKKLKENPVRIDEIYKGMDVLPDDGIDDYKNRAAEVEYQIEGINHDISDLKNGGQAIKLKQKAAMIRSDLEMDMSRTIRMLEHDREDFLKNFDEGTNEELRKLKYRHEADKSDLSIVSSNVKKQQAQLEKQEQDTQDLRQDYSRIAEQLKTTQNERKEFDVEEICSCCGQRLPEDQIESHREKQQAKYNEERANKITALTEDLERIKKQGAESASAAADTQKQLESSLAEQERIQNIIEKNESKIAELEKDVVDPKETEQYRSMSKDLEDKKAELNNLEDNISEISSEYKAVMEELESIETDVEKELSKHTEKLETLKSELAEVNEALAAFDRNQRDAERIEALKEEQEKLAERYEEIEALEDKLNIFTTEKVALIEDNIADKFEFARFNLFKEQLNGGLEETCEATYKGVPYDEGLNTGGQIKVGLDIIRTLSRHYDFIAPIIIDNAESIHDLPETEAQQIRLIVSKAHKKLKLEAA